MIGSSQLSSPKRLWVSGFFIHFCSISVHICVYLTHCFGKQVQRINVASVLICPFHTLLSRSKKRRGKAFWKFLAILCWFAKRFPQGRSTVGLETVCAVKDHFQNLIFYQHYYVILVQLVFGVFFFILLKCNFIKNTFKFLVQNKTWCSGFDYHLRTAYSKSIYLLYIGLTLCDLPVEVLLKIFSFLHLPDFLRNLLPIQKRFQHICDSQTLWRHFCFAVDCTRSSFDHIFQHFFRSFSFVGYMGQLKLEVQPEYIEATIGWCIELTELHISYNCIIQNLSFLLNMSNLATFTMKHCCNVDAQTAVQALKKLPKPKENCFIFERTVDQR